MKFEFTSDNVRQSFTNFPVLKLKAGEKARILAIESPEGVFVHTLRAPAILNGQVVVEEVKTRTGEVVQRAKEDFIGKHQCLGNMNTLLDNEIDPENCPTCEASKSSGGDIPAPKIRYAMHVVKYKCQQGSFKVATPFSAELLAWSFPERVFNNLVGIVEEHGDLRQHDLLLGPCENELFQKFTMAVGGGAAWLENDERKNYIAQLYEANKTDDLASVMARKLDKASMRNDVETVMIRLNLASGGSSNLDGPAGGVGSAMDVDALLGSIGGGSAAPAPVPTMEPVAPVAVDTPTADEPDSGPSGGVLNFDQILKGL